MTKDSYVINVVNVKDFKGPHYYVGRPSPLGNPFTVKEHGRHKALELYKDWLGLQYSTNNTRVKAVLNDLSKDLENAGSIVLSCWCTPKKCHAEIIGEALIALIKKRGAK